ncbi:MAG: ERF family protein [Phascolarctobacterium sp.]|uniref:ERF family protein n=1 Tax=Phascolarctobacterium sp. TaxID=2049039 RepID=UPI0026DA8EEF|nr:ERF family protein [Phascolarctobacterium sp.]MDO4921762.1 ERF family protein [Phascolarctobacterium sp.]
MENMKIARKLVKVMADCSHIAKNGLNSFHNYKYATAEDVLYKVNEALARNNLACFAQPTLIAFDEVTNLKGNKEHLATVSMRIQIVDSESGEAVEIFGLGSGQDAGDKAVMKAQTAAIKYAYMMSLCIATGDDPEADSRTDEVNAAEPQAKRNDKAANTTPKETATQPDGAICTGCGAAISEKVLRYSVSKYGQPFCMNCQKTAARAA